MTDYDTADDTYDTAHDTADDTCDDTDDGTDDKDNIVAAADTVVPVQAPAEAVWQL